MKPETAKLIATIVSAIAGIAGVLIGLFADRMLQRHGKVRCVMEPIEVLVLLRRRARPFPLHSLPIPGELVPEVPSERDRACNTREAGRCLLKVKLFKEKEVRTDLRDVVVAFEGRHPMEKTMLDPSAVRNTTQPMPMMDTLEVVNLPSREWVTFSLMTNLEVEEVRNLTECDRVWLRGYFPDGRRFNERVPFQKQ